MRLFYSSILAGICWCRAAASPALACRFPIARAAPEIAHAHVMRVEKNGALILTDGRAAMLEGIRLPLGAIMRAAASG